MGRGAHNQLIVLFVQLFLCLTPAPALLPALGGGIAPRTVAVIVLCLVIISHQEFVCDIVLVALALILI